MIATERLSARVQGLRETFVAHQPSIDPLSDLLHRRDRVDDRDGPGPRASSAG